MFYKNSVPTAEFTDDILLDDMCKKMKIFDKKLFVQGINQYDIDCEKTGK